MPKIHRKNPPQTHQDQDSWRWQLDVLMLILILTIVLWISVQIHLVNTSRVMDAFFGPPASQIATFSDSESKTSAEETNKSIVQSSQKSAPSLTETKEKQSVDQETTATASPQQETIAQREAETAKPVKKPADNIIIKKEDRPTQYVRHRESQSQPTNNVQPQHNNVTSDEEQSQDNTVIPPQIY